MKDFDYMSVRAHLLGDDAHFRSNIPLIREHLLPELRRMEGFRQHTAHGGLDPVEHTVNVLYALETGGLSRNDAEILRAAGLLHDAGKKDLPERDPEHAERSVGIAIPVAEKMGFDSLAMWNIVILASTHVHLGKYLNRFLNEYELKRDLFASRRLLGMHLRLITADTKSMPAYANNGCAKRFLEDITLAYSELLPSFINR